MFVVYNNSDAIQVLTGGRSALPGGGSKIEKITLHPGANFDVDKSLFKKCEKHNPSFLQKVEDDIISAEEQKEVKNLTVLQAKKLVKKTYTQKGLKKLLSEENEGDKRAEVLAAIEAQIETISAKSKKAD